MDQLKQEKINVNWKWIVVFSGLLWMLTFSNRMILSPLMGLLKDEWNMTAYQIGLLGSSIYLPYLIFQMPSGILADKWDRKKVLIWGGILQGLAMIGCTFSHHVLIFGLFRALTGLFSATLFSSLFGYISEVTPEGKKVVGIAIVNFFMPVGVILGMVVTSEIVFRYQKNWGLPFLIFGLAIIISSILLGYYTRSKTQYKKPTLRSNGLSKEIIQEGQVHIAKDKRSLGIVLVTYISYFKTFIKNRNLLSLSLISFIQAYTLFNIFTWLPYFLGTKGFNALDAGNFSSFAYLLALPTTVFITLKADKNRDIKGFLILFMIVNLISNFIIVSILNRNILIFALIIYGLTARLSTTPLHIYLVTESSQPQNYSKDLALFNSFSCVSMMIAPVITGYLYDLTGKIQTGFYLAIFMELFAILLIYFGVQVNIKDKKSLV